MYGRTEMGKRRNLADLLLVIVDSVVMVGVKTSYFSMSTNPHLHLWALTSAPWPHIGHCLLSLLHNSYRPMPVKFNQDATCLSVSSPESTLLFYCDPPGRCYEGPGGLITEMLFSTSLIASIDISQRHVTITNTKKHSIICELTFPSTVVNVEMNRKRVIVELIDQLMIYDVSNMKLIHTIHISNTKVSLSPQDNSLLVYQHSPGQITLFDSIDCKPLHHFQPHSSELQLMKFSCDGKKLATTSIKGTIIRVYDLESYQLIHELRRGSTRATIISISLTSNLLLCSSSHSTIHFFKLDSINFINNEPIPGKYLPTQLSSFLKPKRHFASVALTGDDLAVVAIGSSHCYIATKRVLFIYTLEGTLSSSFPLK